MAAWGFNAAAIAATQCHGGRPRYRVRRRLLPTHRRLLRLPADRRWFRPGQWQVAPQVRSRRRPRAAACQTTTAERAS